MKKYITIFYISVYIAIVLGLILHTSSRPQLFGKYTYLYAGIIILFVLFFIPSLLILRNLFVTSRIKLLNNKITLTPAKKIVLIALAIFVLLIPVEYYLRNKFRDYETNNYMWTINNFHPFLQLQNANDKPGNKYHFNSYGFRAEEITKEKPRGTYRIFVLGGSTVLNSNVDFESSAPRLLEKMLKKQYPTKKFEVINVGVEGYTTQHSLIQYLFNIKDFQPDMIIMWHGINDWYYSCSTKMWGHGPYKPDYSHYYNLVARMVTSNFSPPPVLSVKLLTLDRVSKALRDNLYSDVITLIKSQEVPQGGIYAQSELKNTYDEPVDNSLQSFKRNIISLIHTLQTDDVSLLLADQPFLYSESLNNNEKSTLSFPKNACSDANGKYPSMKSMITALNMYNQTTRDIAKSNNIPFVSIAAAVPKTSSYFIDDVHYTKQGNKKVAETLFKYIRDSELIQ